MTVAGKIYIAKFFQWSFAIIFFALVLYPIIFRCTPFGLTDIKWAIAVYADLMLFMFSSIARLWVSGLLSYSRPRS